MDNVFKAKLMVVEDSDFSRAMVVSNLKRIGFEIIDCPETSIEAWEQIASAHLNDEPYDLVLTDLNMPGFDGIDLISRIKEDPMSAKQKIVVISADADPGIQMICRQLGVLAYFTKPLRPESFEEVILAIVRGDEKIPEVKNMI